MKFLCLIPVYFLVLINAGQQPINEVPDHGQSFDGMPQLVERGIAAVTVPCTIEKDIFYSSSGTFYTTVKLGNCDAELKTELISTGSWAVFNQCAIKPNCSSSANVSEDNYYFFVQNPLFSYSKVRGPLISDYINWGCNFPIYGPQIRHNKLGFAFSHNPDFPSFFESLINSRIIGNPTLCLAVKSSYSFNSEDKEAGKLLIGKSIPEVFSNSYDKFGSALRFGLWNLQATAASINGKNVFIPNTEINIDTSTPYIVMDGRSYTNFLDKLQNDFGIECLEDSPRNEGEINVCYVDCAMASNLPYIGLTLRYFRGAVRTVEYFLENNLVTFGSEDRDGRCSLAIAGRKPPGIYPWRLGTSFFNGRTVCFESISGANFIYIGSSGL